MKKNILVISDGNGVDTDFKKWPFYLKLLTTKTSNIINKSVIGAGNEFIFMQLADTLTNEKIDYAVIQWSIPNRLDVVSSDFWCEQAVNDKIYHFNLHDCAGQKWWVSSASKNEFVRTYHNLYVRNWQAQQRTQSLMLSAAELLKYHNIDFVFSLAYEMQFTAPTKDVLSTYPWVWHEEHKGLSEYRRVSKFSNLDTGLPQPHTLIQLDWINTVLKPACHFIDFDYTSYYNIENHLLKNV